jgi:trehalose 6-phosphate phosphatase
MADILANRHRAVLAQFAASNVLLAFDFDGTLAPIVSKPAEARMRPRTRRLLSRIATQYPCVVISGRTLPDLQARLGRIPVWHIIGTFGHEPSVDAERSDIRVRQWMALLKRRLPTRSGLVIEEKPYSITIHHRNVRNKRPVLDAIAAVLRDLPDVRALSGIQATSLLRHGGPNKGTALQRAQRMFACDTAIFVGDDATDEDAFVSAGRDRLLAIRVGAAPRSHAQYRLTRQANIDNLLRTLLALRSRRARGVAPSRRKERPDG